MELFLPNETVSHLPDIKEVNINPVFPNRTALLHIHNMAHSRAFFYSYVLQTRFKRPSSKFNEQCRITKRFIGFIVGLSRSINLWI